MNFKKGDIIELEIHDMAFGGKGISRVKTEDGDFVVCAVSGKNIPLAQLTYWNVEMQEAYFSPKEAQQRYEELNKK